MLPAFRSGQRDRLRLHRPPQSEPERFRRFSRASRGADDFRVAPGAVPGFVRSEDLTVESDLGYERLYDRYARHRGGSAAMPRPTGRTNLAGIWHRRGSRAATPLNERENLGGCAVAVARGGSTAKRMFFGQVPGAGTTPHFMSDTVCFELRPSGSSPTRRMGRNRIRSGRQVRPSAPAARRAAVPRRLRPRRGARQSLARAKATRARGSRRSVPGGTRAVPRERSRRGRRGRHQEPENTPRNCAI
jgi:hypothetical protein